VFEVFAFVNFTVVPVAGYPFPVMVIVACAATSVVVGVMDVTLNVPDAVRVPESGTEFGPAASFVVTVIVAGGTVPAAVGRIVTVILHDAPGTTDAPTQPVAENTDDAVPVELSRTAIWETCKAVFPSLKTDTVAVLLE
jgi:hypothetical protein